MNGPFRASSADLVKQGRASGSMYIIVSRELHATPKATLRQTASPPRYKFQWLTCASFHVNTGVPTIQCSVIDIAANDLVEDPRQTEHPSAKPATVVGSPVMHEHWCIACVCVNLRRTNNEKIESFHVKPSTRYLQLCTLSENKTIQYLKHDQNEPRQTNAWPRCSITMNEIGYTNDTG